MRKPKISLSFLIILTSIYLLSACSADNDKSIVEQDSNEEDLVENIVEVLIEATSDEIEIDEALGEAEIDEASDEAMIEEPSNENESWLVGEWKRYLHHHDGFLTIKKMYSDGFDFELQVIGGANTNGVEGRASQKGNTAFFEIADSKCRLDFELNKDLIGIKESEDCNIMGTNRTFFHGNYQQGPNLIEVDLAKLGFLTEAENKLFKTVVGDAYPMFLQNFMLAFEEKDLDNLQVRVISGLVRGVATYMAAIIMINDDYVYAAKPSDGSSKIDYYTNDPAYKKEAPLTIQQWISNRNLSEEINYK